MSKIFYCLVGLPGSGKSTWTENFLKEKISSEVINMDNIRFQVTGNHSDQSKNGLVAAKAMESLKKSMLAGVSDIIWDNTTLSVKYRKPLVSLAKENGYNAVAVFFQVPLEVAKQRNAARTRVVPVDVLDRMFASIAPPSLEEGFTEIIKVSN